VEPQIGRKYSFTVFGEAEPAGSKQAFVPLHPTTKEPYRRPKGGIVVSVVDANKHAEKWKKHVAQVAREEYAGPVFDGFLRVTWIFYQERPQCHYTSTGKLSKQGRETPWPNVAPDSTKLVRGVEDALQGICYTNDAIIVKQAAEKHYGSPARVEITVEELLVPPHEQPELFNQPAPWET
jgi:Holliday junction resolvase RusA-like endonuclease